MCNNLKIWFCCKIHIQKVGEKSKLRTASGNGTPLQYSCLENPMDGEAW